MRKGRCWLLSYRAPGRYVGKEDAKTARLFWPVLEPLLERDTKLCLETGGAPCVIVAAQENRPNN